MSTVLCLVFCVNKVGMHGRSVTWKSLSFLQWHRAKTSKKELKFKAKGAQIQSKKAVPVALILMQMRESANVPHFHLSLHLCSGSPWKFIYAWTAFSLNHHHSLADSMSSSALKVSNTESVGHLYLFHPSCKQRRLVTDCFRTVTLAHLFRTGCLQHSATLILVSKPVSTRLINNHF